MPDIRGMSTATSKEGSRPEHQRLYRLAVPDLDLRGGRQDYIGNSQANHSSRDVRLAATGRGREGSGGHDREDHDGDGVRLIDCAFGSSPSYAASMGMTRFCRDKEA